MLILAMAILAQAEATKESLELAIRGLHQGMAAEKSEDRVKALQAVLPKKEDVQALLGAHEEKIWPRMEAGQAEMLRNIDKVSEELTRHGELKSVKLEAVEDPALLKLLPKATPVFDYTNTFEKGAAGGGSYVWVRGRWVFFRGLTSVPRMILKD